MSFVLLLAAAMAAAPAEPVVLGRLDRPVLALAHAGPAHVLVLEQDRLSLWRTTPSVALEATLDTAAPAERVRHAGGLIHAPEGEDGGWVHRSGWPEALLVSTDGGALAVVSTAAALPWPGAPGGVRFRAGTSLVDGRLDGLPDGPYITLSPDGRAGVSVNGRLLVRRGDDTRAATAPELSVGSALAHPWPDVLVASSASPDTPDALLVVHLAPTPRVVTRVPIHGRVQALAARLEGPLAVVLAAVEDEAGVALVRVEVRPPAGALP